MAEEGCPALPGPSAGLLPQEAGGTDVLEDQVWKGGLLCEWHISCFCRGLDSCWGSSLMRGCHAAEAVVEGCRAPCSVVQGMPSG